MAVIGNSSTQQAFTPAVDYFSGNASTTAFTLSRPVASVAQVQVVVNNVAQNPSSAYTISSNTITFTSAPSSGTNNIYVYYTSPITQVIAPGQGTVTATSMASSTGTGAGVFQTSPTITTPVISSLSSASSTALTLQSAGTTAVTIDTSQNVFIGQTSATGDGEKFAVVSTTTSGSAYNATMRLTSTTTGAGSEAKLMFNLGSASTGISYISSQLEGTGYGNLTFATRPNGGNPSERMRISSAGNVYVNTTGALSPDNAYLSVSAAASTSLPAFTVLGGAGPWAIKVGTVDTTSTRYMIGICNNSGATLGGITTNGTVITYGGTSDYRLKENIEPMSGALAKIAQLNPVTYTWKSNGSVGDGFIAHELAEVFPDAVAGVKDAVENDGSIKAQMIDQSKLVATLTAAIQELSAKNDALTARIEALENK